MADPHARRGPDAFGIGRLFGIIPDAIIIATTVGEILHWNPGAAALFGYSSDEAIGKNVDILVPPSLREAHRSGLDRYRSEGRGHLVDTQAPVELRALTKGGTEVWVELRLAALADDDGTRHVLSVVRDISDRRRLLEEVEAAAAQEEERSATLRSFVSMAAHDLRGPLRMISSFLELLTPSSALSDGDRQVLERIDRLATRAADLSDDMLALLAIEAGAETAEPEAVEVLDVVAEVAPEEVAVMGGAGVVALVDRAHLVRIFDNLVSNALKYGRPPVQISASADGESVEIVVRDHGDGVPHDHVAHLFTSFARAPGHASTAGAGLGLASARRLAQLNGGTIVYRHAEPGAEFCLRLPAANR